MAGKEGRAAAHAPTAQEASFYNHGEFRSSGRLRKFALRAGAVAAFSAAVPAVTGAAEAQAVTSRPADMSVRLAPTDNGTLTHRDPAALPRTSEGTRVITIHTGTTEYGQAEIAATHAHVVKENGVVIDVTRINHGLQPQQDPTTLQPEHKLRIVDRIGATLVATAEKASKAKEKSPLLRRFTADLKRLRTSGKPIGSETAAADERLADEFQAVVVAAQTPGSHTQTDLQKLGFPVEAVFTQQVAQDHHRMGPALPHKEVGKHTGKAHKRSAVRHHQPSEASEPVVSAAQNQSNIKLGEQLGVFHTTKLDAANVWDQQQTSTIRGVILSDAATNPANRITQGINPGLDFKDMQLHDKFTSPTQMAELFLAGIGTMSHQQLMQLHGKISHADFARLQEIAELNHQSNRATNLTQENRQATQAFVQLVEEHAPTIAQHADQIKKMITFIEKHPEQAQAFKKKFKETFATIYAQVLTRNTAPTQRVGTHMRLAPSHVEPGNTRTYPNPNASTQEATPPGGIVRNPRAEASPTATPTPSSTRSGVAVAPGTSEASPSVTPSPSSTRPPETGVTPPAAEKISQLQGEVRRENVALRQLQGSVRTYANQAKDIGIVEGAGGALLLGGIAAGVIYAEKRRRRRKEEKKKVNDDIRRVRTLVEDTYNKGLLINAVRGKKLEFVETPAHTELLFVNAQIQRLEQQSLNRKLSDKEKTLMTAIYTRLFELQKAGTIQAGRLNHILSTKLGTDEQIIERANEAYATTGPANELDKKIQGLSDSKTRLGMSADEIREDVDSVLLRYGIDIKKMSPTTPLSRPGSTTPGSARPAPRSAAPRRRKGPHWPDGLKIRRRRGRPSS